MPKPSSENRTPGEADEKLVYTLPQVARMLQCSERHIIRLVQSSDLPSLKLGGNRRVFPARAFHAWFDQYVEEQTSAAIEERA